MGELRSFRVPFAAAESEFTEKRSRFIGHIWPVETEAQAQAYIRAMKKRYYDARHNCWCYLVGESIVRYSDDGEPQGTAGQPMLNVFQRENVTNVCCVVTRYFGGILLGAGGLTRAYSKGARDALAAAGVSSMGLWTQLRIPCTYPLLERVKLELAAAEGLTDDTEYGADVTITASLPQERVEPLCARLTELSAGGIVPAVLGESFRPGPREEIAACAHSRISPCPSQRGSCCAAICRRECGGSGRRARWRSRDWGLRRGRNVSPRGRSCAGASFSCSFRSARRSSISRGGGS